MSYKKILVTLDGSDLSESAIAQVHQIAGAEAVIHLLSVLDVDRTNQMAAVASALAYSAAVPNDQWPRQLEPEEITARENYLRGIGAELERLGCQVTVEVLTGRVIESILKVAHQGYDVIVMATHNRTGLNKLVFGSVSESVLHQAPCPVLIVPNHPL